MAKSNNHTGRPKKMSMQGMSCKFVHIQAFAKRGTKCTPEEKEWRLAAQQEAQKRMEENKVQERACSV